MTGTDFQRQAWQVLLSIPYGHTISYKEQAARVGRPTAFRAVAQANHANSISIVVPCHRVIAADGSAGGFAAGVHVKQELLALERSHRS